LHEIGWLAEAGLCNALIPQSEICYSVMIHAAGAKMGEIRELRISDCVRRSHAKADCACLPQAGISAYSRG
jgi:hypothetical protein